MFWLFDKYKMSECLWYTRYGSITTSSSLFLYQTDRNRINSGERIEIVVVLIISDYLHIEVILISLLLCTCSSYLHCRWADIEELEKDKRIHQKVKRFKAKQALNNFLSEVSTVILVKNLNVV